MGTTNTTGTAISAGTPDDVSLCRVSGFLKDLSGTPLAGTKVYFSNAYAPLGVAENTLFLGDKVSATADADGLVSIDLLQGASVRIQIPSLLGLVDIPAVIPEDPTVNLLDLVCPYVVSVSFDDDSPVSMEVEDVRTFPMTGLLSNGQEVDVTGAVTLEVSDDTVLYSDPPSWVARGVGSVTLTPTEISESNIDKPAWSTGATLQRQDPPATVLPGPITVNVT